MVAEWDAGKRLQRARPPDGGLMKAIIAVLLTAVVFQAAPVFAKPPRCPL